MSETTYQTFPESGLAVVRFVGTVTVDDLEAVRLTLAADPLFHASFRGVGDMRAARFEQDLATYRAYVERLAALGQRSAIWALLVETPRETAFQMIWQNLMNPLQPSELYITPEAAIDALGASAHDAGILLARLADPTAPLAVHVPPLRS